MFVVYMNNAAIVNINTIKTITMPILQYLISYLSSYFEHMFVNKGKINIKDFFLYFIVRNL